MEMNELWGWCNNCRVNDIVVGEAGVFVRKHPEQCISRSNGRLFMIYAHSWATPERSKRFMFRYVSDCSFLIHSTLSTNKIRVVETLRYRDWSIKFPSWWGILPGNSESERSKYLNLFMKPKNLGIAVPLKSFSHKLSTGDVLVVLDSGLFYQYDSIRKSLGCEDGVWQHTHTQYCYHMKHLSICSNWGHPHPKRPSFFQDQANHSWTLLLLFSLNPCTVYCSRTGRSQSWCNHYIKNQLQNEMKENWSTHWPASWAGINLPELL